MSVPKVAEFERKIFLRPLSSPDLLKIWPSGEDTASSISRGQQEGQKQEICLEITQIQSTARKAWQNLVIVYIPSCLPVCLL